MSDPRAVSPLSTPSLVSMCFSTIRFSDELRGDESAPKASLVVPGGALHSMTANNGESDEGADGDHIPRPIGQHRTKDGILAGRTRGSLLRFQGRRR